MFYAGINGRIESATALEQLTKLTSSSNKTLKSRRHFWEDCIEVGAEFWMQIDTFRMPAKRMPSTTQTRRILQG